MLHKTVALTKTNHICWFCLYLSCPACISFTFTVCSTYLWKY